MSETNAETGSTQAVLAEVAAERARQDKKWGSVRHLSVADGTGPDRRWVPGSALLADSLRDLLRQRTDDASARGEVTFLDIALEEVAEAFAEDEPGPLRTELIQCAAVFVKWVEKIDNHDGQVRS